MRKLMILIAFTGLTTLLNAKSAPHAVGFANAGDAFLVANTPVTSGATIFDGDSVEAGSTRCLVYMKDGSEVTLAPHSAAELHSDRLTLQKGSAEVKFSSGTLLETDGFTVKPISKSTEARLKVAPGSMTVAVLSGQAQISNLQGAVLAHMVSGASLNFAQGDSPSSGDTTSHNQMQTRFLGVLDEEDGHFLIRDRSTNAVAELLGDIPEKYVNRLTVASGTLEIKDSAIPEVHRVLHVDKIETSDAAAGWPCVPDGEVGVGKRLALHGTLSKEGSHYLVADRNRGTYEVIGEVGAAQVGKDIDLVAYLLPGRQAAPPAEQVVYAEHRRLIKADSPCVNVVTSGVIITAAILSAIDGGSTPPQTPISY